MSRLRDKLLLAGCAVGSLLLAQPGAATQLTRQDVQRLNQGRSPTNEPLRVLYGAPEGCPGAASFMGQILDLAQHQRAARPGELARAVRLKVTGQAGGFHGDLSITLADGREATGTFLAPTCQQVTTALAIVAAVSLQRPGDDVRAKLPANPYVRPRKRWDDLPENPYGTNGSDAKLEPTNPFDGKRAPGLDYSNPYNRRHAPAKREPPVETRNPFYQRH